MMKKIFSLFAVAALSIGLAGCGDFVEPGNVGIKVDKYGSDKGVQTQVLTTGWYWTGFTSTIYEFPTFEQTYSFDAADSPKDPGDNSIAFQSAEGLRMSADVGLVYTIDPTKVPVLFQTYRRAID